MYLFRVGTVEWSGRGSSNINYNGLNMRQKNENSNNDRSPMNLTRTNGDENYS